MINKINNKDINIKNNIKKKKNIENNNNTNKTKISFTTEYNITKLYELNDGRILTFEEKENHEYSDKSKICVYNINNDIITCDICYEKEHYFGEDIIQMDDNNIIITNFKNIQVIKIKKNSFEIIQIIELDSDDYACPEITKFSQEKIIIDKKKIIYFFIYKNAQLNKEKEELRLKYWQHTKCLVLNENEIAIYYDEDGYIYGTNNFLLFYDMKNYKKIKTLKVGGYNNGGHMCLFNEKLIIINMMENLIIVDFKSKKMVNNIKKERFSPGKIVKIDNDYILLSSSSYERLLILYKFVNHNEINEYIAKSISNDMEVCGIYFNNKLIIIDKKNTINIYNNYKEFLEK